MKEDDACLEFGGFRLDRNRCLLFGRDGRSIPLKPRIFDTLLYLVEHPGQLLDKDDLMKAVWGGIIVEENNLNKHISALRRVFGEAPGQNSFIVTVPGRGYRFVAPVKTAVPESRDAAVEPAPAERIADAPRGSANARSATRRNVVFGVLGFATLVLLWQLLQSGEPPIESARSVPIEAPPSAMRLDLNLTPGLHLTGGIPFESAGGLLRPSRPSFALSPNGRDLVYAASDGQTSRLYRRRLDQTEAAAIPGTEGATQPFFSPDSRWVGFNVGDDLKTTPVDGGELRSIALSGANLIAAERRAFRVPALPSSWTEHDTLLVPRTDGIYEVPSVGGEAIRLTHVDRAAGENAHVYAQMLPQRRAVLFNVRAGSPVPSEWFVSVQRLDGSSARHVVLERASHPVYLPTGHIVFARNGSLLAVPFDLDRLEIVGSPIVVLEDIMHAERGSMGTLNSGAAQFSVSSTGALAYVSGGVYPSEAYPMLLVDRSGASEPLPLPPARYLWPRFSPDGKRLVYGVGDLGSIDVWVHDIPLGVTLEIAKGGGNHYAPVWSPDGRRIAFGRPAVGTIYSIAADGSGALQPIAPGMLMSSWVGDVLAFLDRAEQGRTFAIWTASVESGERRMYLRSDGDLMHPALSPDGQWLAYTRAEAGRMEVYVRHFPEGGEVRAISAGGGHSPVWSRDGAELFFIQDTHNGMRMMVADSPTGPDRARPRALFEGQFGTTVPTVGYDVSPDGQRFAMTGPAAARSPEPATSITIVLNWFAELDERAPARLD